MIRHVVLLTWNPSVAESAVQQVSAGFAKLAEEIPAIKSYSFGPDLAMFKGNADFALVAEFASEEELRRYVAHPAHQAFMANVTGPIMASFVSAQFLA